MNNLSKNTIRETQALSGAVDHYIQTLNSSAGLDFESLLSALGVDHDSLTSAEENNTSVVGLLLRAITLAGLSITRAIDQNTQAVEKQAEAIDRLRAAAEQGLLSEVPEAIQGGLSDMAWAISCVADALRGA